MTQDTKKLIEDVADIEYLDDSSNKSEYYKKIMVELDVSGQVPKRDISKVGKYLVEKRLWEKYHKKNGVPQKEIKIKHSLWYKIAGENGYTNPYGGGSDQSTTPPAPYHGVNLNIINKLTDVKSAITIIQLNLKNMAYIDKNKKLVPINLEGKFPKQSKALLAQMDTITNIALDTVNSKTKVPQNMHSLFRECLRIQSGLLNVGVVFQQNRLDMLNTIKKWIDKKQAYKFFKNEEPNIHDSFKPKSRDMALFCGWSGHQCVCESWRTRNIINSAKCFDCGIVFTCTTTLTNCKRCHCLFYADRIKEIIANDNKCVVCQEQGDTTFIDFPTELKAIARRK